MRLKSVIFCILTLMFVLFGCNQEDGSCKNVQALKVYNLDIDFLMNLMFVILKTFVFIFQL